MTGSDIYYSLQRVFHALSLTNPYKRALVSMLLTASVIKVFKPSFFFYKDERTGEWRYKYFCLEATEECTPLPAELVVALKGLFFFLI